jgi:transposase-like protein
MSAWRRAGQEGRLGAGDLPPLARPSPRVFTSEQKAALVQQHQEAKAQGPDDVRRWLGANNLTRKQLSRWRQELASPRAGYGNPEPGRAVPDDLHLPEIGPVEAYTLDDLPRTHRRYARQEKRTLLTEYGQLDQGQGTQWLRDHHLSTGLMSTWRREWEEGLLGMGDPPPPARQPHRVFTTQEKATMLQHYQEAKARGPGASRRWLEANSQHSRQLSRWRRELASRPPGYGNPEPSHGVPDDLDLPEIGPVEAYTLDDLPPTHRTFTLQEKVTLLTEYAQLDRGQTTQWLRARRLSTILMSRWRRARREGRLGEGDLPPLARPSRRAFTIQEKVALVRQYQEAKSQGGDVAKRWREANNLTRDLLNRWPQQLALPRDPASPDHGNPEPGRAVPDYLDLPEIGPAEAYPLGDPPRTHRSHTGQEKLALLTEYTQLDEGQGSQWLHDRHLTYSLMRDWRDALRKGRLGEDDQSPTARPPRRVFTPQEKATLLRQYDEAKSKGPSVGKRWREANNLTPNRLSRWRQELPSRQDPAWPPSGHGNPEPSRTVPDDLDLPEIGPGEAHTPDNLRLTQRSYTRQEKLALLTEYAQLQRGQKSQWLQERHLTTGLLKGWRRARTRGRLGEGDLPPLGRAPRRTFTRHEKATLLRQYDEARSKGPSVGKRWREANSLSRDHLCRWRRQLASRLNLAPPPDDGNPELNTVEVDPAGWEESPPREEFPPDARFPQVGPSTGGGEPSGVNEYLVDPMDSWWATALTSATSTPDAWDTWDAGDQGNNGQGTAEPDRHHDGASSSRRSF